MKKLNYKHTIIGCFIAYMVQAVVCNFAPLLFVGWRNEFNISMPQLTTIVTVTFFTQIVVDLISAKYAEKIGVNPRTLRDWIRAFKSFDGGFINITEAANDPSKLVTNYGMEMEVLEPDQVKKKSSNFTRFDRDVVVIEIGKMKLTTSLGCARELLSKEIYDLLRQN